MTMHTVVILFACGLLCVGCGDDTSSGDNGGGSGSGGDGDGDTDQGGDRTCWRDDVNGDGTGEFCIHYVGIPAGSVGAVEAGCTDSWGGMVGEETDCSSLGLTGRCILEGDTTGNASSAIIYFSDVDHGVAEDDVCGSDGVYMSQ